MIHLLIATALLLGTSALAATPDLAPHFTGKDACFTLYDTKTKQRVAAHNPKRCAERFVACSTFKVPLALMAIDKGLIKDSSTPFKWDRKTHEIQDWNQDQTAATWIKYSVVWVSQLLTPQLGLSSIENYLSKFDYGNQDMSGGLTTAWLTSGSKPTLKISPDEQLRFLERLWSGDLPVSKNALELTRKLTYLGTSPRGAILHGKTGSTQPTDTQMGWFVGHLFNPAAPEHEYVFVLNFSQPTPKTGPKYAGYVARELSKEILTEMGLF